MLEALMCAAYFAAGALTGVALMGLFLLWAYKTDPTHNGPADKNWDFRRRTR